MATAIAPKRLELLSELIPRARLIALLVNSNNLNADRTMPEMREAARPKGVDLPGPKAGTEGDINS